jgi:hypothetical protein
MEKPEEQGYDSVGNWRIPSRYMSSSVLADPHPVHARSLPFPRFVDFVGDAWRG